MHISYQKEANNQLSPTLNTKKITTCDVENPGQVCIQHIWLLRNTFNGFNVMNYFLAKLQWLSNK